MVEYYGRLYGIPEDKLQLRIDEIFDVLQMHEIRDRLGGKMSTGMKQKVSIARTIVHDPPVIIFDEPTSGLDVLVARAVLKAVAALRDQGKCIIFSTHIMREVEKLCDRIAVIHCGRFWRKAPCLNSRIVISSRTWKNCSSIWSSTVKMRSRKNAGTPAYEVPL